MISPVENRRMPSTQTIEELPKHGEVVPLIAAAWRESSPGRSDAHEEGGFIVVDERGKVSVERWPIGVKNEIVLPSHKNCKYEGRMIVASFHTHPNTGKQFQQEPSLTDIRAVRDDPDLRGEKYVGELVISAANIYLIEPNGKVTIVGETVSILPEE